MTQERETPKNRKQIGMADKKNRIYIEDFVVSYLRQIAALQDNKCGIAGLFGTCREVQGCREFYIYGAAYEETQQGKGPVQRESVQKIMRKRIESFEEYFFLGWCVIRGKEDGAVWENYYRSRMDSNFGMPEILLTIEKGTLEEHFYTYPTDMPKEVEGYFIFYEQNEKMQSFMIDAHWKEDVVRVGEADDVAKSCREFYKEKRDKKRRNRLALASCAFFAVLILFVLGNRVSQIFAEGETARETTVSVADIGEESVSVEAKLIETGLPGGGQNSETILSDEPDAASMNEFESQEFEVLEDKPGESEVGIVQEAESLNGSVEEESLNIEDAEKKNEQNETQECATYVVNKGDTLYGICISFYGEISLLEEICELNGIEDMNNILCGQKILLPKQNM